MLTRRSWFAGFAMAGVTLARRLLAEAPAVSLRGRLKPGQQAALVIPDSRRIALTGDDPTKLVLTDVRLADLDFEGLGHWETPARFLIDPMHLHAMFIHKDGKRLHITYWCDVCSIRTMTPGLCVCCQKYTDLDLRETIEP
jgi:hypothetical protein